jgi:hypothetical protein
LHGIGVLGVCGKHFGVLDACVWDRPVRLLGLGISLLYV